VIDCGNSGTTMRLLAGILAGRPFAATLDGDESLRRRPMRRIMEPLGRMGAEVLSRDGKGTAPLRIRGGALRAIHYVSPVASAQVKSAVILAGLQATGTTVLEEPQKSRDHTEIMAGGFGAKVRVDGCTVSVEGPQRLSGRRIDIPGDLSAAAFFLVAGAVIPGSDILIRDVGLNPTRTGVIDVLRRMGAEVECRNQREAGGEPVGDLRVVGGRLRGVDIGADMVARTIDEYPILSVAAALAEGVTRIFGAGELRTKESDRIAVTVRELRKLGVSAEEREDGMDIEGCGRLRAARVDPEGDHRVAMAFAIAGLVANGGIEIEDSRSADISFPGFFERLEALL
jgi:3-phosphoshikimate 1-carboxyvinyltransferase